MVDYNKIGIIGEYHSNNIVIIIGMVVPDIEEDIRIYSRPYLGIIENDRQNRKVDSQVNIRVVSGNHITVVEGNLP